MLWTLPCKLHRTCSIGYFWVFQSLCFKARLTAKLLVEWNPWVEWHMYGMDWSSLIRTGYHAERTSSSVLMFLGELLGLLTNIYWSSQRTSSNWLAWGLSQCARLTSGTRFHLRLKAAHLSLSLKLSLRPIFFDKHIFRLSIFFLFLIFRTFRLLIFSILRIFYIF